MLPSSVLRSAGFRSVCTRCPISHVLPQSSSSTSLTAHQTRWISTAGPLNADDRSTWSKVGLSSRGSDSQSFARGSGRNERNPPAGYGRRPKIVDPGSQERRTNDPGPTPQPVPPLRGSPKPPYASFGKTGQSSAQRGVNPLLNKGSPFNTDSQPASPRQPLASRRVGSSLAQTIDYLKQARASDTIDQALHSSTEHYTTRHLGKDVDFSKLPSQPRFKDAQRRIVKFQLLDLEDNLPIAQRLVQTTFHCPEFILRSLPRDRTPHSKPPPFPEHLIDHGKKAHKSIGLGIVTSKAKMSKLAVERNRARRRLIEALHYVVNRGVMCPQGVDGWDLVSEDTSYFFHLYPPVILLPMDQLCQQVFKGLDTVRRGSTGSKARPFRR